MQMKNWFTLSATVGLTTASLFMLACGSQVDRSAAKAQTGAPEVAQVEIASIPYDASQPRYVVAVLPFNYGASGAISGSNAPSAPRPDGSPAGIITGGLKDGGSEGSSARSDKDPRHIGPGIAAQLRTALARWPNVSIIDPDALIRQPDGSYTCKLQPGEVGPFVVRGTVTEFNETADLKQEKSGASLGGVGGALAVGGAIGGSMEASLAGIGLAAANPTYQDEKTTRKGMVGMDMEILDGRTSRLVSAFNSSGTFTTMSAVSGASVFGIGGGSADFAASALGQATRAAMNDALRKTAEVLKTAPR